MRAKTLYGVIVVGEPALTNDFTSQRKRSVYVRGLKKSGFTRIALSKSKFY